MIRLTASDIATEGAPILVSNPQNNAEPRQSATEKAASDEGKDKRDHVHSLPNCEAILT